MTAGTSLLFVDAYDSFTNNIVALLYQSAPGVVVEVIHIDTDVQKTYLTDFRSFLVSFDAVVLGPGPGDPHNHADIGCIADIWPLAEEYQIPVLGICLGFQSLCLRYGLPVVRMNEPCHGQSKRILSHDDDIFSDLQDLSAVCYNSLAVRVSSLTAAGHTSTLNSPRSSLSSGSAASNETEDDGNPVKRVRLLAWDNEGNAMAVKHRILPFWGIQFHPESCKSHALCRTLLENWVHSVERHNCIQRRKTAVTIGRNLLLSDDSCANMQLQESQFTHKVLKLLPSLATAVQWRSAKASTVLVESLRYWCYDKTRYGSVAMLESSGKGRFSIYSFTDSTTVSLCCREDMFSVYRGMDNVVQQQCGADQAMRWLEEMMTLLSARGGDLDTPFWGGLVGYFSYEFCLDLLKLKSNTKCKNFGRIVPDFEFSFVDRSIVHDKVSGEVYVQSLRKDDDQWLSEIMSRLENGPMQRPPALREIKRLQKHSDSARVRTPDHDAYIDQISTCRSHLYAGNSYELCLTTEATITVPSSDLDSSFALYNSLNLKNPVPFASLLHFPCSDTTILSTSPEQFLTTSRTGTIDMKPMKGTVARTRTTTLADARRILATTKESAENLMIADLIRHDLYGTVGCHYPDTPSIDPVQVIKLNEVTEYETVYQLTSHIRALPPHELTDSSMSSQKDSCNTQALDEAINPHDPEKLIQHNFRALRHTLPPGSMTGAPKARSCQILSEIEQRPRGIYSGIIGFFDVGGSSSWSVAIRTAFSSNSTRNDPSSPPAKPPTATTSPSIENLEKSTLPRELENSGSRPGTEKIYRLGAGGAITVLSDNESEHAEMSTKLQSVLRGFGVEESRYNGNGTRQDT